MVLCPGCNQPIASDDINVAADVAFCRACNNAVALSGLVRASLPTDHDAVRANPPSGAWFRDDGVETTIGATTRSPTAFFIVPFMIIWSGFSLGGIYGSQIANGQFNVFMSLFGIPFLLGSILFWAIALMTICGRVEVRLRGEDGSIFTGIAGIGWNRKFNRSEFSRVREDLSGWQSSGHRSRHCIVLEGSRRLTFGSMLNEPRRYFVMRMVEEALIH